MNNLDHLNDEDYEIEYDETFDDYIWDLDEEFEELFPGVSLADIPEEVYDRAYEESLPLVAAYALYDRKLYIDQVHIEEFNKKNAKKSPGKIKHDGASEGLFTFDQIKRMSPSDVNKHYDQIMKSLENMNNNI